MEPNKNPFSYSRAAAALFLCACITGAALWLTPAFGGAKKDGGRAHATTPAAAADDTARIKEVEAEDNDLIRRLTNAGIINPAKGYAVRRQGQAIFIDDLPLSVAESAKYLQGMQQQSFFIEVYPLREWIKLHPGGLQAPFVYPAVIRNYHHLKPAAGC